MSPSISHFTVINTAYNRPIRTNVYDFSSNKGAQFEQQRVSTAHKEIINVL